MCVYVFVSVYRARYNVVCYLFHFQSKVVGQALQDQEKRGALIAAVCAGMSCGSP